MRLNPRKAYHHHHLWHKSFHSTTVTKAERMDSSDGEDYVYQRSDGEEGEEEEEYSYSDGDDEPPVIMRQVKEDVRGKSLCVSISFACMSFRNQVREMKWWMWMTLFFLFLWILIDDWSQLPLISIFSLFHALALMQASMSTDGYKIIDSDELRATMMALVEDISSVLVRLCV